MQKVPITKERISNICKRINQGKAPSTAVREEGLGGLYLSALKDSGIVFIDPITRKWQAMVRIHDDRYAKFVTIRKQRNSVKNRRYQNKLRSFVEIESTDTPIKQKRTAQKRRVTKNRTTQKVGVFRRIWNSIFG